MQFRDGHDPYPYDDEEVGSSYDALRMLWRSRAVQRRRVTEWMTRKPVHVEVELPEDVTVKLALLAAKNERRPEADELVRQIPDVVDWFREQMVTGSHPGGEEDIKSSAGPSSRPPFRVAAMAAADREVAALAYWCQVVGLPLTEPLYLVHNVPMGVSGTDPTGPVGWMADDLAKHIAKHGAPDGIYTDPQYGLWAIRSSHYGIWPELGAMFTVEPDVPDTEEVEEQESLF